MAASFRHLIILIIAIILNQGCFIYPPDELKTTSPYPDLTNRPVITFSLESGFYGSPQDLELTCSKEDVQIYYSIDGSVVSQEAFTVISSDPDNNISNRAALLYSGPINISDNTLIRAQAFIGATPVSQEFSKLYLLNENTSLPVFSLVVDPRDFWDHYTGIYVDGPNDGSYPKIGSYSDQNYFQDWEKPVHFEFFETDHSLVLESSAGVKIFGGWSRQYPQKSLALFARPEYGSSSFDYDFFQGAAQDQNSNTITSYKSIVLRNSGDDWYRTMFRDAFLQSLAENMDIDNQAYRPAVVYLNGQYWGIHNIREKINEDYLAAHYDVDPDGVDILTHYDSRVVEGSDQHFRTLLDYAEDNDLSDPVHYAQISQWVDINNFMDYTILELYINNIDWPVNNIKYWRPHTSTGKWRFLLYDTDPGFGGKDWIDPIDPNLYTHNTLNYLFDAGKSDSDFRTLFVNVIENKDFRDSFILRFQTLLGSDFSDNAMTTNRISAMESAISAEITDHMTRWPDIFNDENPGTTRFETWTNNIAVISNYAINRPGVWGPWLSDFESEFNALVRNGDFGDTGAYWNSGWVETAGADFTYNNFAGDEGGGTVVSQSASPAWDDIIVCYQESINLSNGSNYTLSFQAWGGDGSNQLAVALFNHTTWTAYSDTTASEDFYLVTLPTAQSTTFNVNCHMIGDDGDAWVAFFAGKTTEGVSIHIDNVSLVEN